MAQNRLLSLLVLFFILVIGVPMMFVDGPASQIEAVFAASNVALGVLALFGSKISDWIFENPSVEISLSRDGKGILAQNEQGTNIRFYHLRLKNKNRHVPIRKVSAHLVAIEEPDSRGGFEKIEFPPLRFAWPYEVEEGLKPRQDLQTELYCDLCRRVSGYPKFEMSLVSTPYSLKPVLARNRHLRLHVEIRGDNYSSPEPIVIELRTDEGWDDKDEKMTSHFSLRIV